MCLGPHLSIIWNFTRPSTWYLENLPSPQHSPCLLCVLPAHGTGESYMAALSFWSVLGDRAWVWSCPNLGAAPHVHMAVMGSSAGPCQL